MARIVTTFAADCVRYDVDGHSAVDVERAVAELLGHWPAAVVREKPDQVDSRWCAVVERPPIRETARG